MALIASRRFYVGLDLGQSNDRTALCVLERTIERSEEINRVTFGRAESVRYDVRHLERPPLGTPYPAVVQRVGTICEKLKRLEPLAAGELIVDGTGVGRPVVDLLRAAELPYALVSVSITGGDRVTGDSSATRVPKRDLVAALVVMFQCGSLRIAERLNDAQALVHELVNFRVRVSAAGHDSYGNNREAQHDDLVLAAALAAWRAQVRRRVSMEGSQPVLRF